MPADTSTSPTIRFGLFEADLRTGELRKSGVKTKIQELPFRALKLFLARPNEIVSRDDLRQALWPDDVFVDFDRGIITAINRLRDSLGDSSENPIYLETVGRRGYRWIAPVQVAPGEVTPVQVTDDPSAVPQPGAPPPGQAMPEPTSGTWPRLSTRVVLLALLMVAMGLWLFRYLRGGSDSATQPTSVEAGFTRRAANKEAEDFYLRGRFYWNKRTPESLNQAVDAFTQALVHDPNYAQAYVGLADCYNLLREYSAMPASEAYPRAYAAAKKAVELDDRSSAAHASLAFVSFYGMWQIDAAGEQFRRALELDPNNAIAHHWYANYLRCLQRYPEALAEIERAQELAPSSAAVLADKGLILAAAGRWPEGIALLKQVEAAEPDFESPSRHLARLYLSNGQYADYLVEQRKLLTLTHDTLGLANLNQAAKSFASGGPQALLMTTFQQQKGLYDQGSLSPMTLAETCAVMGKKQEAIAYLKIAYDSHTDGVAEMASRFLLKNLEHEPGYLALLRQVGLPLPQ
jgi:DNA-binding winged helix-turn-helix (wHTH) protein/tetratricopeptide (TPR) repeat protein